MVRQLHECFQMVFASSSEELQADEGAADIGAQAGVAGAAVHLEDQMAHPPHDADSSHEPLPTSTQSTQYTQGSLLSMMECIGSDWAFKTKTNFYIPPEHYDGYSYLFEHGHPHQEHGAWDHLNRNFHSQEHGQNHHLLHPEHHHSHAHDDRHAHHAHHHSHHGLHPPNLYTHPIAPHTMHNLETSVHATFPTFPTFPKFRKEGHAAPASSSSSAAAAAAAAGLAEAVHNPLLHSPAHTHTTHTVLVHDAHVHHHPDHPHNPDHYTHHATKASDFKPQQSLNQVPPLPPVPPIPPMMTIPYHHPHLDLPVPPLHLPWYFALLCWSFTLGGIVMLCRTPKWVRCGGGLIQEKDLNNLKCGKSASRESTKGNEGNNGDKGNKGNEGNKGNKGNNYHKYRRHWYPYRTFAWLLILLQGPSSFLADYIHMTNISSWHVIDRFLAVTLMSLELLKILVMRPYTRPVIYVLYLASASLAVVCFMKSQESQGTLDCEGFVFWHCGWHCQPVVSSLVILLDGWLDRWGWEEGFVLEGERKEKGETGGDTGGDEEREEFNETKETKDPPSGECEPLNEGRNKYVLNSQAGKLRYMEDVTCDDAESVESTGIVIESSSSESSLSGVGTK